MVSIYEKSLINSSMISDLDNFRFRYQEIDDNFVVTFPGFNLYSIDKNLHWLQFNSSKKEFISRWDMRPDYTSYDFYNTVIYWPLILYINGIPNIENYTKLNYVLIPTIESISSVIEDRVIDEDVKVVDYDTRISNLVDYFIRYPMDKKEIQERKSKVALSTSSTDTTSTCTLLEKTETFSLDSSDITNKYVDLVYSPYNPSNVSLYINSFSTPQTMEYDYVLKNDDYGLSRRISWASGDCDFGNGLVNYLESGDELRIVYLYGAEGCTQPDVGDMILDGGVYD